MLDLRTVRFNGALWTSMFVGTQWHAEAMLLCTMQNSQEKLYAASWGPDRLCSSKEFHGFRIGCVDPRFTCQGVCHTGRLFDQQGILATRALASDI